MKDIRLPEALEIIHTEIANTVKKQVNIYSVTDIHTAMNTIATELEILNAYRKKYG